MDGCDPLFCCSFFRTLPVGEILGCLLVCVRSIFFLLFYSTASLPPQIHPAFSEGALYLRLGKVIDHAWPPSEYGEVISESNGQ